MVEMHSPGGLVATCFLLLALIDILDCDVFPAKTMRAGIYLGVATVLEPVLITAALLLLVPVAVIQTRAKHRLRFGAGIAVPLLAGVSAWALFGGDASRWAPSPPSFESMRTALRGDMTLWRFVADTYFLAAFAPFLLAVLAALMERQSPVDRRGAWLILLLCAGFAAATSTGVLPSDGGGLSLALTILLLTIAAGLGVRVLLDLGRSPAGRPAFLWGLGLTLLFLAPSIVGWVQLLTRRQ
jgi:hypothetical protein